MNGSPRIYILLELECGKDVPDLTDKVAGRAYCMDGVEGATAMLLTTAEAFRLAKAQTDGESRP